MSNSEKFVVQSGQGYGRLPVGFAIELGDKGYFSISGLNNAGKTTILQWLLTQSNRSIYIPAERGIVRSTIDSNTIPLEQYIQYLKSRIVHAPLDVLELVV